MPILTMGSKNPLEATPQVFSVFHGFKMARIAATRIST